MATPRHLIVDYDAVGVYHCFSRCVRRSFLCGFDSYINKNYEHRKPWIFDRAKFLGGILCIDIIALTVMSNHYHIILRNRPDLAGRLSPVEVARRINALHPIKEGPIIENDPAATVEARIHAFACDEDKVDEGRAKLHNISIFMANLNEFIARAANKEDEVTGRFWEGRFRSDKVMDVGALLHISSYVDLNVVRAAIAENLEDSDYTAIQERLKAEKAKRMLAALPQLENPTPDQLREILVTRRESERADWLTPFEGEDNPFGSITFHEYVQFVEYAGKKTKEGKRGSLPPHLKSILAQYDVDAERWAENVQDMGNLFYRIIGKAKHLKERAKAKKVAWFCGKKGAAQIYTS